MRDKMFSLISHDIRNCVGNLKNISAVLNAEINSENPSQDLIEKYSTLITDNSTNTSGTYDQDPIQTRKTAHGKMLLREPDEAEESLPF